MKKRIAGMIGILAFTVSFVFAQKPAIVSGDEKGWYRIGKISASFKKETESIIVMGKDEFASLKLRVIDAPINIERVQVHFEGGKIQEVDVKQPLKEGEETREINLEADNKEIDKVVFTYQTAGNDRGEKAEVELYGFKSRKDGDDKDQAERTSDQVSDDIEDQARDTKREIKKEAREAEREIEENAEAAAESMEEGSADFTNEVNEAASKAEAEITDEKFEDKVGPAGQTVYIDDESNYYWVDENGNRNYLSAVELRDK